MKYDIPAALQELKPGAQWVLRGFDYSGLEWVDSGQTKPTETELTDKQKDDNNIKEKLFLICDFVKNYFKTQFNESNFGRTIASTYFDERGFDSETLEKFDIGSLGSEKYNLRDHCLSNGYIFKIWRLWG